jgi:ribose transport system substrate-binding protein
MRRAFRYRLGAPLGRAALIPLLAGGLVALATPGHAQISTTPNLAACGTYDAAALDPRPVPPSLGGQGLLDDAIKAGLGTPSTVLGAAQALDPTWYNTIKITPAEAKEICDKHLTAVYLDWSGVPYNLAMESGAKTVMDALGIKLLRITNFNLNSSGLAGVVAAILPLHPDFLITGGTINPAQFAAVLKPAMDQGISVVSWAVGSPTLKVGQSEPVKSIVTYDFYNLGVQLADAVHKQYPDGANLGYIHWVNDVHSVHARENGFLDRLKAYPNIHVVTMGKADPGNPASGFTNANSAAAFTSAFLTGHPEVNVLFAPWEDPPGLGEAAAIKTLHLENKVHIVTMDMGSDGAFQMKHKGIISVDMAQDIYDAGRMLALLGGLAAIGKDTYPYVIVPTYPVTSSSDVIAAWDFMHGPQVPCPADACK